MPALDSNVDAPLFFDGVGRTYRGGTRALDGFSLKIAAGEFVALVGPSGCGKSTALRLAAGLASPSTGRVLRDAGLAEDGAVGCVFQEPTLTPWSRVEDNVRLPLRLRGVSKRASKGAVDEALDRVGLSDFRLAYPRQLSGGMKMRVAVARATVSQPRLLMLDEPFAALDEITRSRLNDDLLTLWRTQGWACLFVTHSVYEAVYLASRVVVMTGRPGRVAADIEVPLPRPRTEASRRDPAYAELCGRVSAALGDSLTTATGQGASARG